MIIVGIGHRWVVQVDIIQLLRFTIPKVSSIISKVIMQKIVCFSGQMQSGKDTAADMLAECLNDSIKDQCDTFGYPSSFDPLFNRVAWADSDKDAFCRYFGKNRQFIEDWKRESDPPPGYLKTMRESLQWIGDGFRQIYPDVWVDSLFDLNCNPIRHFIISDGRYPSEWQAVQERKGINILMWRPGYENTVDHPSESQIIPVIEKLQPKGCKLHTRPIPGDGTVFDYFIINDGTKDDLRDQIAGRVVSYTKAWFDGNERLSG